MLERAAPHNDVTGVQTSSRHLHHCTACGWEWFGRTQFRPTRCPRCLCFTWDRERPAGAPLITRGEA